MDSPEDFDFAEVVERARTGDGAAFETLFRRFNRPVAAFAAARRASDPEGVVNEVFIRVFRNLPTFEGSEAQFSAWIFRIARNLVIDEVRRQSRRIDEVSGPVYDTTSARVAEPGTSLGNPEHEAIRSESDALVSYLDHLTAEQRDVILLRVVADQSIEVVAATLGKSIAAVKSIQYRATRVLRDVLEKKSDISAT